MSIEDFFEQEKGITIDAARNSNARYTAIDMAKFAKKYHEEMSFNNIFQIKNAFEFGYKQCEKGNNLEMAFIEFDRL